MTEVLPGRIERLAGRVRDEYGLTGSVVNVEKLVAELGGGIEDVDVKALPTGVHGRITKTGAKFLISVPQGLKRAQKRLIVAHELGHVFLHMGFRVDDHRWEEASTFTDGVMFRTGYSQEEVEADAFAVALLIPDTDLKAQTQMLIREMTPAHQLRLRLSEVFDVPLEAMNVRINALMNLR